MILRNIELDLSRQEVFLSGISLNQGNRDSVCFTIRLFDNGVECDYGNFNEARATFGAREGCVASCLCEINAGNIRFMLPNEAFARQGLVSGQLDIALENGGNLSTGYFNFTVTPSIAQLSPAQRRVFVNEVEAMIQRCSAILDGMNRDADAVEDILNESLNGANEINEIKASVSAFLEAAETLLEKTRTELNALDELYRSAQEKADIMDNMPQSAQGILDNMSELVLLALERNDRINALLEASGGASETIEAAKIEAAQALDGLTAGFDELRKTAEAAENALEQGFDAYAIKAAEAEDALEAGFEGLLAAKTEEAASVLGNLYNSARENANAIEQILDGLEENNYVTITRLSEILSEELEPLREADNITRSELNDVLEFESRKAADVTNLAIAQAVEAETEARLEAGYVTQEVLDGKNYVTMDGLSSAVEAETEARLEAGYVTQDVLDGKNYVSQNGLSSAIEAETEARLEAGYVTQDVLDGKNYVTQSGLSSAIEAEAEARLEAGYVTQEVLDGKNYVTQSGFESLVNNALADASFASAEAVAEAVEDQRLSDGYVKATDLDHLISAKLQAPYEPGDGFSTFHFDLRQYAIGWLEAAPANRNMSQASLACVGDRFYFFGCYNPSLTRAKRQKPEIEGNERSFNEYKIKVA